VELAILSLRAMGLGVPLSKRTFIHRPALFQALSREVQNGFHLLLGHVEYLSDLPYRQARLEIFGNRLNRHARALQNPSAAYLARYAFYRWAM
jgi:hypothetical protein